MEKIICSLLFPFLFGCAGEEVQPIEFNCTLEDSLTAVEPADAIIRPLKPYGKSVEEINGREVEREWQQFYAPVNDLHFSILSDWKVVRKKEVPILLQPETDTTDNSYFGLITNPKDASTHSLDDYIDAFVAEVVADSSIRITEMVRDLNDTRELYFIEISGNDEATVYFSVVTESSSCVLDFTMKTSGDYILDKAHYLGIVSSITIGEQSLLPTDAEMESVDFGVDY